MRHHKSRKGLFKKKKSSVKSFYLRGLYKSLISTYKTKPLGDKNRKTRKTLTYKKPKNKTKNKKTKNIIFCSISLMNKNYDQSLR